MKTESHKETHTHTHTHTHSVCVCVRQVMLIYGIDATNYQLTIPVALSSSRNMCRLSNNFQLSKQSR